MPAAVPRSWISGETLQASENESDLDRPRRLPGVAQAVHQQMALAPRELSVLSAADENVILANCW